MSLSVFTVPRMDCPTEAGLIRMKLGELVDVSTVDIDLPSREVKVRHAGDAESVHATLASLGLGAELVSVTATEPVAGPPIDVASQRTVLWIVLAINAVMFVVELVAGLLARSTGLLADSLDMLADALVYVVGLNVVARSQLAQHRAALAAGIVQLVLGLGVLIEVVRRAILGTDPTSTTMMITAAVALLANLLCARLLHSHRDGGAHMKASWIFTKVDAVANLGVILAGVLVYATGSGIFDLVIGTAIAVFVLYEGLRIVLFAGRNSTRG